MTKNEYILLYLWERYNKGEDLRHDVLTNKVMWRTDEGQWRELTQVDVNSIANKASRVAGKNLNSQDVRQVLWSDYVRSVHPLREWLGSLRPYDPASGDWIELLADDVTVEEGRQALWRTVFHKWFLAMVASWLHDEDVNQNVLVLIGPQGIYKTTWLEHLIPPALRHYSMKLGNIHNLDKDERIRVSEAALINIDEIDALSDQELNRLKSLITSSDTNERAPYAATKERRVRLASFCASGNKEYFLSDMTGNRRFLPFRVEHIVSPFGRFVPYELLYAQAVWELSTEEGQRRWHYWFDQEETRAMGEYVNSFMQETSEEQLLPYYFEPAGCKVGGNVGGTLGGTLDKRATLMSAAEIGAVLALHGNIRRPLSPTKMGLLLKSKGFILKKIHGKKGYLVIRLSNGEAEREATIRALNEELEPRLL